MNTERETDRERDRETDTTEDEQRERWQRERVGEGERVVYIMMQLHACVHC